MTNLYFSCNLEETCSGLLNNSYCKKVELVFKSFLGGWDGEGGKVGNNSQEEITLSNCYSFLGYNYMTFVVLFQQSP